MESPEKHIPEPRLHHSEDEVLDHLHRCTEGRALCTEKDAQILHRDFSMCEAYEMYESYVRGEVPTFTNMQKGIERVLAKMPSELLKNDREAKVAKLILGRTNFIKGNVQSYAESVIRFVRVARSDRSDPELLVKIDHDRRRKHDNLLTSLTGFRTILDEAVDLGLLEPGDFSEWLPGDTKKPSEHAILVFSRLAIANRDLIKNWALAADFAEQYKKLTDAFAK